MSENVDHDWARKTKERDQPKSCAQRKKPKFFACPEPLRHGRPRERGKKRLTKNCADRQQENCKNKFHPTRRHRKRLRRDEVFRARTCNTSDNLPAALGIAPSAIACGSSLRCSQSCPQIRRSYANKSKTEPRIVRIAAMIRGMRFACAPDARGGCPTASPRSCASHVRAGARVDLDRFAFLDEKRDVDRLSGLQLCRFGDVAGGIASYAFC